MAQAQLQYDTIISGGGMVGMTLAVALARAGMQVALVEKAPLPSHLSPTFDGRVSAIALGSKIILDNIGVWDGMKAQAEPITDIRVSDGATPFFLHYDHFEVADATGGEPFGYIVENRYIRYALQQAAEKYPNLKIMDKTLIENFTADDAGMTVHLKNKDKLRCNLLISAEGKQSFLRKASGIGSIGWDYPQTAIVCTIEHEKPHHGLAQERFLPAGPFAVLPMTNIPSPLEGEGRVGGDTNSDPASITPHPNLPPQGGKGFIHRSSLVWVEPSSRVQMYMDLADPEFVQEIQERVGDYLGKISQEGQRFSYPLSLIHAKTYVAKRLALIGDAAHGIHPIAGQGVNLGFRDVGVLAELLTERFSLGLDIGSPDVLEHYERWRRFDNVTMLAATDLLNRLFSTKILPIRLARDFGLWAVGKMPPLKRVFMKHAMGLSGDLPKLTRKN